MKKTDKLIDFLRSNNEFKELYERGITSADIKNRIIDTLQPFFNNRKSLDENAINLLVPDYINLKRVRRKYSEIDKEIKIVLGAYLDAISINSSLLYETISELMPEIIESGNKFWTFIYLERNKAELEFPEFVKEIFENIGDILEGIMKAQIVEHVAVNRIVRKKPFDLAKIRSTKLGILFDELIQHSKYPHLLKTQPDGIRFTDWRNISAHKNYQVKTDIVLCKLGIPPNEKSFSLSRTDLFNRVNQIVRTLEIFNLSHKFFGFDNIDHFKINKNHNEGEFSGRDEIWLLFFITGICSQGFEVLKFDYETGGNALMIVKDLTNKDPKIRGIHTSQFIFPIWLGTRARNITVEYRLKNDISYLKSSSDNKVCEAIYNGSKLFEYLAEKVRFELICDS